MAEPSAQPLIGAIPTNHHHAYSGHDHRPNYSREHENYEVVRPVHDPFPHHGHPHRPVDLNNMKRNMSIAKGFMDISLLTANANQLRQLIVFGNRDNYTFHIILTGLVISLVLQVAVGVMLILKERFDINFEDDHKAAELYNNITILLVFLTLLLNVFISSFGVDLQETNPDFGQQGIVGRSGVGTTPDKINLNAT